MIGAPPFPLSANVSVAEPLPADAEKITGGAGIGNDTLISIEGAVGTGFSDTLTGDAGANAFYGGLVNVSHNKVAVVHLCVSVHLPFDVVGDATTHGGSVGVAHGLRPSQACGFECESLGIPPADNVLCGSSVH